MLLILILFVSSKDNHRNGTLTSDTRKRKVKHNIEKGTATISNIKGQNIEEDISDLMELSKMNGKVIFLKRLDRSCYLYIANVLTLCNFSFLGSFASFKAFITCEYAFRK